MSAVSELAALGEPVLAVADPARHLLAVACANKYGEALKLGLFETGDRPRMLRRIKCEQHINTLAFHPSSPLLAVGLGDYDGGYHFMGQLLLVGLEDKSKRPMFAESWGRQVITAEWLDETRLRMHLAPYDDDKDDDAHHEAHVVVLDRPDWTTALSRSIPDKRLQGPRIPFPRPAHDPSAARQLATRLLTPPSPRHH
ncbi:hypothetical protein ACIQF6_29610 [Kitasatospora sp. NPDC092948]|uniref:hypothetical protein n=1 Tax=Kitasatospora sp. NPDC092948 TaxID=3364088 RepID=UPI003811024C